MHEGRVLHRHGVLPGDAEGVEEEIREVAARNASASPPVSRGVRLLHNARRRRETGDRRLRRVHDL
jgi:hypothetical protein